MGRAMPRHILLWHHSALFVQGTRQPHTIPPKLHEDCQRWAKPRGMAVSPPTLRFFQLHANMLWESTLYMAFSAKAFCLLRQGWNVSIPSELHYNMPLLHHPMFHNKHFHSYACHVVIHCNVLSLGQLLADASHLGLIAPTWRVVYRDPLGQLATNMYEFDAQAMHPTVCFSTLLAE